MKIINKVLTKVNTNYEFATFMIYLKKDLLTGFDIIKFSDFSPLFLVISSIKIYIYGRKLIDM